jgi:hypothetical protein
MSETAQDALNRAQQFDTMTNYPAIYRGFLDKGIPEDDIQPRVNIFRYKAWKALGRVVRRGEKGVRILTYIPIKTKDAAGEVTVTGRRPWTVTVFHVSQTVPLNGDKNGGER